MQHALCIKWIGRLCTEGNGIWRHVPCYYFNKLGSDLSVFNSNVDAKNFIGLDLIKSNFYKKLLIIWLNHKCKEETKSDNLWNNTLFVHRQKPLFFKYWQNKGVNFVKDVHSPP